jgi:hypothetical protein
MRADCGPSSASFHLTAPQKRGSNSDYFCDKKADPPPPHSTLLHRKKSSNGPYITTFIIYSFTVYELFCNLIGWITRRISAHIRRVAKNKMAVQKLHEFCEAEKRKIFALRKIIVQGKTLKKIWQVSKIHLLHRN